MRCAALGETVPYLGKGYAPLPAFASKSWLGLAFAKSQSDPQMAPQKPPVALPGGTCLPCSLGLPSPPGEGTDVVVPPFLSPGLGRGPSHVSGLKLAFLPPLGPQPVLGGGSAPSDSPQPARQAPPGLVGTGRHKKVTWLGRLVTKVAAVRAEGKT